MWWKNATALILTALLVVSIFAIVAITAAWWRVPPSFNYVRPACGSECELAAACNAADDSEWREVALWGVVGAPDVNSYPYLEMIEPLASFSGRSRFRRSASSVGRVQFLLELNGKCFKTACTGTLISPQHVLTAAHCAIGQRGATRAKVLRVAIRFGFVSELPQGEGRLFELDRESLEFGEDQADFMVLRFPDDATADAVRGGNILPVRLARHKSSVGDDMYIIGHPYGVSQVVLRAQCRSRAPHDGGSILRTSCRTAPGMSGAPIFDDLSGAVVGIHTRALKVVADPPDTGYGIPLEVIAARSATVRALVSSGVALPPNVPEVRPPGDR